MKLKIIIVAGLIASLIACKATTSPNAAIIKTEEDFARMAAEKGIAAAFYFYADSNVVINANDSLIHGRNGVLNYYSKPFFKTATLTWHPDSVAVSSSNDLAYTYGKYQFISTDSTGKKVLFKGIFHTVWKKQPDDTWRFVWD